jgi:replicative DNA helicase
MMLEQEAIANAAGVIRADDFYKPAHAHVFDAIHALYAGGQPVDPVTVADELRRSGLLDVVGGHQALVQIMSSTPATTNAPGYARIIEEHALLRRLIGVAGEIAEIGYSMPDDVTKALDRAETLVYDINQRKVTDTTAKIEELLGLNLDRLEQLYGRGDAITGTPTGYADLDDLLSGLQPSTLVIVGARPSMGKALALDTAIPTPAGWTTMGELQVGDEVLGDDGAPCRVTYVSPVQTERVCYEVAFDDGSTIVADADHQWLAYDRPAWQLEQQRNRLERRGTVGAPGGEPRVVTTQQMLDEGVVAAGGRHLNWCVPLAQPLDLPECDLPIDPYVLGWWITTGSAPPGEAPVGDHELGLAGLSADGRCLVPPTYLRASTKQRLALVQGVLDARGTVVPDGTGTVELCLADRSLAGQVRELVCSLGHAPGPVNRRLSGLPARRARSSWWFRWAPLDPVFRLDDKLEQLGLDPGRPVDADLTRRAVHAIRPVAPVPVRCITVDSPRHLYLAGDTMVPTHNTSFALGMASHAALYANRPVLVFSLEMGNLELSQRMLCGEARIDSSRVRTGKLNEDDWNRISGAIGRLASAPIWMDDNPNLTVMEIRSKARRLKSQVGDLGMIIIDYLQLMTGRGSAENRQVEVSEMSRGLKILARELECPVVALSQLSRQLEMRADKRPMLADLRESGCLTADARVLRADTGGEVTIGELAASGERDIPVWSLDTDLRMVPATMTHAFPTGAKEVFELQLGSGRRVTASANHPFLTVDGWLRLDELSVDSRIAVPRSVPTPKRAHEWPEHEIALLAHLIGDGCFAPRQPIHYTSADPVCLEVVEQAARHFGIEPRRVQHGTWTHVYLPSPVPVARGRRNPIAAWLDQWGLYGKRSHEKYVPAPIFALTDDQIALFLGHLWATDGCVGWWGQGRIYYASTSRRLIDDVQLLLLRLGVRSTVRKVRGSPERPGYQLHIDGRNEQMAFLDQVEVVGQRAVGAAELRRRLADVPSNTNVDTVPVEVWARVRRAIVDQGMTTRAFASALGTAHCGSSLYRHAPSRSRLGRVAEIVDDDLLGALSTSDVFWDRVLSVKPLGEQQVFDATVEGTHNFVANGVVVENSIEQDADVVMFIYRDDVYNSDSPDRGQAEIIVSKHRNGPTGVCRLAFLEQFTRFANMARVD